MTPEEVLSRLAEKYAKCRSYSDSGVVEFDDVRGNREQLRFRTEFVRPDYFRFEWQDYGPNRGKSESFSTVWSNGDTHFVLFDWKNMELVSQQSLQLAIAAATGCSAGAAHVVPALLLNELRIDCKHLLQLTDLEMTQEDLGDNHFYVLKGSLFRKDDHILWVMASDFSLRRVTEDHSKTAAEAEESFKAVINNKELMTQLTEHGIAPPRNRSFAERHDVSEYIYSDLSFDASILRLPEPRGAQEG